MAQTSGGSAAGERIAPTFELLESKLTPSLPTGSTPRARLLNLLENSRGTSVILVSAAPGYGKTTLLAQWASQSQQRFAWVTVDDVDNDPIVLLTYIAVALDRVSAIDPNVFHGLTAVGASIEGTIVPRLGAALERADPSFVLVLDDLHALTNPQCLDAVDALIDHVPQGAQLVISGRVEPSRRVGALRAGGRLTEIGPDELRMQVDEARVFLEAAGVRLADAELAELVDRTEGWPAGLYLAALSAQRESGVLLEDAAPFRGDDRFVADYLRSELLSRLPRDEVRFLTQTSVLERMSGPFCDAVLESKGSASTLESLRQSNRFVVALDQNREWYRYHHLFRELLRSELERAERDRVAPLLSRAADWCDANGESEAAVGYARAAGDVDRVAELVMAHGQSAYQRGRAVTVERWLEWLEQDGGLEQNPRVAVLGAWLSALRGRPGQAERWTEVAERGAMEAKAASIEPWLALLRCAQCRDGIERMGADAELAMNNFGRAGRWWPTAAVLLAISYQLSGEDDRADDLLADVVETAVAVGAWNAASLALAERAVLAIERGAWAETEPLVDQAQSMMRRSMMEDYPPNLLVFAASARLAIRRREPSRADALLAQAQRLRPQLTRALAPLAIQARIELASAYAARADIAGARTLLRESDELFRRGRDFGKLATQAEDLRSKLKSLTVDSPGASTLTNAELRLLPLLSTHLSFREIGERVYLSRHTVKSHAMSIYRKLEVNSRTAAVERARDLGLL